MKTDRSLEKNTYLIPDLHTDHELVGVQRGEPHQKSTKAAADISKPNLKISLATGLSLVILLLSKCLWVFFC